MFRLGILLYLIDPELEFGCMMLGVVDNLKLSKVVYFKSWLLVAILCVGMDGSVVIVGGIIEFTASCVGPVLTATFPIY